MESRAWNSFPVSPIAAHLPESRISVPADRTRYNPNLSEEEPLLSASTFEPSASAISRHLRKYRAHPEPAPVDDLRQILTVLAYVELVALHGRPITRCCLLHLITEAWNPEDSVQRQL